MMTERESVDKECLVQSYLRTAEYSCYIQHSYNQKEHDHSHEILTETLAL